MARTASDPARTAALGGAVVSSRTWPSGWNRSPRHLAETSPTRIVHEAAVVQMLLARGETEEASRSYDSLLALVPSLPQDTVRVFPGSHGGGLRGIRRRRLRRSAVRRPSAVRRTVRRRHRSRRVHRLGPPPTGRSRDTARPARRFAREHLAAEGRRSLGGPRPSAGHDLPRARRRSAGHYRFCSQIEVSTCSRKAARS